MQNKIVLEIGIEDAFLMYVLQGRDILYFPRNIYDKIYDYLVQENRLEDKNKLFKYRGKVVDETFEELVQKFEEEDEDI